MQYACIQSDWFRHSIPVLTEKLTSLAGLPNLRAIEVSSFKGRSAIWMLENLLTHPTSHLTCIDGEYEIMHKEYQVMLRKTKCICTTADTPLSTNNL